MASPLNTGALRLNSVAFLPSNVCVLVCPCVPPWQHLIESRRLWKTVSLAGVSHTLLQGMQASQAASGITQNQHSGLGEKQSYTSVELRHFSPLSIPRNPNKSNPPKGRKGEFAAFFIFSTYLAFPLWLMGLAVLKNTTLVSERCSLEAVGPCVCRRVPRRSHQLDCHLFHWCAIIPRLPSR